MQTLVWCIDYNLTTSATIFRSRYHRGFPILRLPKAAMPLQTGPWVLVPRQTASGHVFVIDSLSQESLDYLKATEEEERLVLEAVEPAERVKADSEIVMVDWFYGWSALDQPCRESDQPCFMVDRALGGWLIVGLIMQTHSEIMCGATLPGAFFWHINSIFVKTWLLCCLKWFSQEWL